MCQQLRSKIGNAEFLPGFPFLPESTLKSASLSLKEEGVKAYRIIYVTKEGVENSILINIKTAPAKTAPATK